MLTEPRRVLKWATVLALLVYPEALLAQVDSVLIVDRRMAYRRVGGQTLTMDIFRPRVGRLERRPAVVCVHGGSWNNGDRSMMVGAARDLAERGFVAATIDYRLSGEARFPAPVSDVRWALGWLAANSERFGIDPGRMGLFGVSAGGHLALMAATVPLRRPDIRLRAVEACVAWAAPSDFVRGLTEGDPVPQASLAVLQRFMGVPFAGHMRQYAQASPATHVTPNTPPLFLVHGDRDAVVPFSQSLYMAEAAQVHGVPVTMLRVRNAGHDFFEHLDDPRMQEVWARTVAFLVQRLAPYGADVRQASLRTSW